MAISAVFSAAQNILTIFGDSLDNIAIISRDAAGKILINGGAVSIFGETPTVANTSLIKVFGLAGNDQLTLNEANGALPKTNLFGSSENDVLTGGLGVDTLTGGAGFNRYRLNNLNEGGNILTDFESNEIIQVKASTFGGGLVAGQPIFSDQFRVGAAAQECQRSLYL